MRDIKWLVAAGLAVTVSGCGLGARQAVLNDEDYAARLVTDPVVEMMVEYPSPNADFAYMPSMTIQVVAREAGKAEFRLYHGLWNELTTPQQESAPQIHGDGAHRTPSSVASTAHGPVATKRYPKASWEMDQRKVREEMKDLALASREPVTAFKGCAYPVKFRMVRKGGTVEELSACRGSGGWTRRVSESVERWLTAQSKMTI